jgi:hypothetical protein
MGIPVHSRRSAHKPHYRMKSARVSEISPLSKAHGKVSVRSFNEILTLEKAALEELRRRRRNPALKAAVESALRGKKPGSFAHGTAPRALLFRQLGTPNGEMFRFLGTAKRLGLRPFVLEYHKDKFVSAGNPFKRTLGKMPLYLHTGTDGRDIVQYHTVVDFNAYNGKKISDVRTKEGIPLVEFHHALLRGATKVNPRAVCFDGSEWFERNGGSAHKYYESLMMLLIRDCIMFESYEPSPALIPFMHAVVLPAFEKAQERFGVKPLIARIVPKGEETRLFWDAYPKKVQRLLKKAP